MSTIQTENIYSDLEKVFSELLKAPVRFAEVGKRIKEIRGEQSQEEFSRLLGIEQQRYISSYEHGLYLAKNIGLLFKIANLDPQQRGIFWLLGGEEALQTERRITEGTGDKESTALQKHKQFLLRAAQRMVRDLKKGTSRKGEKDED